MNDITRHPALRWIGALDVTDEGNGLRPNRVPPATGYQMPETLRFSASACSGVRVTMRSDTTTIRLACSPLRVTWPGYDPAATIDIRVDGELIDRQETRAGLVGNITSLDLTQMEWTDNGPCELTFDGLAAGMKDIEVWMPHETGVRLDELSIDDDAAVEAVPELPTWIHYGSSISQCTEAAGPSEIWAAIAARVGGYDVVNLGFGAECHTDQLIARHMRDAPAELISLKLGINSFTTLTERTFPTAVHGFLDTVRDGHPDTPIVLCSPIYCPLAEQSVGPLQHDGTGFFVPPEPPPFPVPGLLTLERTREILAGIVAMRRDRGDHALHYLSGLDLFGEADIDDLPDQLHPNAAGYRRMGERFASVVFGEHGLLDARNETR